MRKYLVLLAATVVAVGAAMAISAFGAGGPAPKVDVCHLQGNGVYNLIDVSGNAVPAHLAHGDGLPGDVVGNKVLGEDCSLNARTITVTSGAILDFGPNGWAGWSCPAGTTVVSGQADLVDSAQSALWKAGASLGGATYPSTPFGYTYTPPEEGFIVQNDNDGEPGRTITLVCAY